MSLLQQQQQNINNKNMVLLKFEGLILSYIKVGPGFFLWRSVTNHYDSSVRPHTETVDLTGEDSVQLSNEIQLDDVDSENDCELHTFRIILEFNNHMICDPLSFCLCRSLVRFS